MKFVVNHINKIYAFIYVVLLFLVPLVSVANDLKGAYGLLSVMTENLETEGGFVSSIASEPRGYMIISSENISIHYKWGKEHYSGTYSFDDKEVIINNLDGSEKRFNYQLDDNGLSLNAIEKNLNDKTVKNTYSWKKLEYFYSPSYLEGKLTIPVVIVEDTSGKKLNYKASLEERQNENQITFDLKEIDKMEFYISDF